MAGHTYVSYCRQDVAYVQRLVQHLAAAGLPVWVDRQLPEHERWQPTQEPAIEAAAAILVVMTPDAEASDRVRGEILAAHRLGKPIIALLRSGKAFFSQGAGGAVDVTGGELPADTLLDRLAQLCGVTVLRPAPAAALPRTRLRGPVIAAALALLALLAASGVAIALGRPSSNGSHTPSLSERPVPTLPGVDPTSGPTIDGSPTAGPSVTLSGAKLASPKARPRVTGAAKTTDPAPPPLPGSLSIDAPAAMTVGDLPASATATMSAAYATDLMVSLSSTDSGSVSVPATVTIPAGQLGTTFLVHANAAGQATLNAHIAGLTAGPVVVTVSAAPAA